LRIYKGNYSNYTSIRHHCIPGATLWGRTTPLGQTLLLRTQENSWSLDGPIRLPVELIAISPTRETLSLIHMIYGKEFSCSSLSKHAVNDEAFGL